MLKIFTNENMVPKNWKYLTLFKPLYEIGPLYSDVMKEPIIAKLLYEIEGTTIVDTGSLRTKYGEIIGWNQLGTGLKCAITQYYLCNGFNDLEINYCLDFNRAGRNVINFVLRNIEYFDKIPVHLTYPGLYADDYSTDDLPICLNGVETTLWLTEIYILEHYRGICDGSWESQYEIMYPELKDVKTFKRIPEMFKGVEL